MVSANLFNPVSIFDNFLMSPDEWRHKILSLPETLWHNDDGIGGLGHVVFQSDFMEIAEQEFFTRIFTNIFQKECVVLSYIISRLEEERDILTIADTNDYDYCGVLYLHPDPPEEETGMVFLRHESGVIDISQADQKDFSDEGEKTLQDWHISDMITNVYNRLVLFPGTRVARILSGFGESIEDGGLIQLFDITRRG